MCECDFTEEAEVLDVVSEGMDTQDTRDAQDTHTKDSQNPDAASEESPGAVHIYELKVGVNYNHEHHRKAFLILEEAGLDFRSGCVCHRFLQYSVAGSNAPHTQGQPLFAL